MATLFVVTASPCLHALIELAEPSYHQALDESRPPDKVDDQFSVSVREDLREGHYISLNLEHSSRSTTAHRRFHILLFQEMAQHVAFHLTVPLQSVTAYQTAVLFFLGTADHLIQA